MTTISTDMREELCYFLLQAKKTKKITYEQIGSKLGRDKVWVAAALHCKTSLDENEAKTLLEILEVKSDFEENINKLTQPPYRRPPEGFQGVSGDPTIYRLYEVVNVYGEAIKALIHEECGDGIMSAIGLTIKFEKQTKEDGDHVVLTLDGKFLPYKKW